MNDPFDMEGEPFDATVDIAATRRAQFAQANASLALESMAVDADDLVIQEAVITGELSHDEAVAKYLERVRGGKA
ncbi:antitoxin VbhA family protein (plasmid) [Ralstonia pseudosolanacearum]